MRAALVALCCGALLVGCHDFSEAGLCRDRPALCEVVITEVEPGAGPADQAFTITLRGNGFGADAEVFVGDLPTLVLERTAYSLKFETSGHPVGKVDLVLKSQGREARAPFRFVAAPVISSISSNIFVPGEKLVISGANLHEEPRVSCDCFVHLELVPEETSPERLVVTSSLNSTQAELFKIVVRTLGGAASTGSILHGLPWELTFDLTTASATSVHQDPGRPGRVYAVTLKNVFRSDDSGATWTMIPAETLGPGNAWAFYPPRTAVATSRGLYVSEDGETWRLGASTQALTGVAIAGSAAKIFALRGSKVFETSDDGDTWTEVTGLSGTVLASASGRVLVGGETGLTEYDPDTGTSTVLWGAPITQLAADGSVIAISDVSSAWARWDTAFESLDRQWVSALSVNAGAGEILVAAQNGVMRHTRDRAIWVTAGLGSTSGMSWVSAGTGNDRTWLVARNGSVYRAKINGWPPAAQ